jgi:uncharacterized membrane protein YhaH (DUF805 family)
MTGRIGRTRYWLLLLCAVVLVLLAATLGSLNLDNRPVQWLAYAILLASGIPVLSATVRRLHDINLGWWHVLIFMAVTGVLQVLAIVMARYSITLGIVSAVLTAVTFIALGSIKGTAGPNRHGPDPL